MIGDLQSPLRCPRPGGIQKRAGVAVALLVAAVTPPSVAGTVDDGLYAFILQTESVTKLPIVKDLVMKSRSVALVNLTLDGGRLQGAGPVCSLELVGNSPLVRVTLPKAFVRSLPPVRMDARISAWRDRLVFEQSDQTLVVGANLKDPRSDELPTAADDPRVVDQDRDGRPGVTVRVDGLVSGEVFVVQRSTSRLTGRGTASGFAGEVRFKNEQSVLGASSPFLKSNRPSIPSPSGSWFRLERLPRGSGCDRAVSRARLSP